MQILAIDPGLRNLAYCYVHGEEVVDLKRVDLFAGTQFRLDCVFERAHDWVRANRALFESADVVVLEKQFVNRLSTLSAALMVVQTVVHSLYRDKVVLIPPMCVKRRFGTSTGEYRANKTAAVAKARELAPEDVCEKFFARQGKTDDLADCYLLARYYLGSG